MDPITFPRSGDDQRDETPDDAPMSTWIRKWSTLRRCIDLPRSLPCIFFLLDETRIIAIDINKTDMNMPLIKSTEE